MDSDSDDDGTPRALRRADSTGRNSTPEEVALIGGNLMQRRTPRMTSHGTRVLMQTQRMHAKEAEQLRKRVDQLVRENEQLEEKVTALQRAASPDGEARERVKAEARKVAVAESALRQAERTAEERGRAAEAMRVELEAVRAKLEEARRGGAPATPPPAGAASPADAERISASKKAQLRRVVEEEAQAALDEIRSVNLNLARELERAREDANWAGAAMQQRQAQFAETDRRCRELDSRVSELTQRCEAAEDYLSTSEKDVQRLMGENVQLATALAAERSRAEQAEAAAREACEARGQAEGLHDALANEVGRLHGAVSRFVELSISAGGAVSEATEELSSLQRTPQPQTRANPHDLATPNPRSSAGSALPPPSTVAKPPEPMTPTPTLRVHVPLPSPPRKLRDLRSLAAGLAAAALFRVVACALVFAFAVCMAIAMGAPVAQMEKLLNLAGINFLGTLQDLTNWPIGVKALECSVIWFSERVSRAGNILAESLMLR